MTTLALPHYQKAGYISEHPDDAELAHLQQVVNTARRYVNHLSEMPAYSKIFFESEFSYDDEAQELLKEPTAETVIETFRDVLEELNEITPENCREIFKNIRKRSKVKGKNLYMAIRVSVTGTVHGPELDEVLLILGKAEALKRIERTLQRIE